MWGRDLFSFGTLLPQPIQGLLGNVDPQPVRSGCTDPARYRASGKGQYLFQMRAGKLDILRILASKSVVKAAQKMGGFRLGHPGHCELIMQKNDQVFAIMRHQIDRHAARR